MKKKVLFLLLSCLFTTIYAQQTDTDSGESPIWGKWKTWGDAGNGRYRNPVLPADYSDIDCIRVNDTYYAISSTFQYSPGMVILQSNDLVNWTIAGHAVPDLTQISKALNWTEMDRYGRGIWAGAIRYHKNKFWIYFGTPDEGLFMTSSPTPEGPWEPLHCLKAEKGWDDCCPFFGDNNEVFFVATHFSDSYKTYLYKLTPDGRDMVEDSKLLINEGKGREANKLYKINGYYYHFYSEHTPGTGRYIMMQRSHNIEGPYNEKRQLSHTQREFNEPNQGGLVQTDNGKWYFLTHHGTGDWSGRIASLLPVTWIDEWPVIGHPGKDGIGMMVWESSKPIESQVKLAMQTSDHFESNKLSHQWEWNYQPRGEMWSLQERPGHLRLKAFRPLVQDNLLKAGNTITQRCFRTTQNVATVKMNIKGMKDGQKSGLCHYSRSYSMLGIKQQQGKRQLEYKNGDNTIPGPEINSKVVWLRSTWGVEGICQYSYSLDGITFHNFGEKYQMEWGHYRGGRIGIYNYNNEKEEGYVDIDWFEYTYK